MKIDVSQNDLEMEIRPREIHLWCTYAENIIDAGLLSSYHDLLSHSEGLQQQRFHIARHRHQYLVTRAMVRSVLSLYLRKIPPCGWVFGKNAFGKPFVENYDTQPPFNFNISHSENLIVLAIALEDVIGVDVESLQRDAFGLGLAKKVFAPIEYENLCKLPAAKQKERFFELWTLKEAYIKACGRRLSIPLDDFVYLFPADDVVTISFDQGSSDDPNCWKLWSLSIDDRHRISLALKSNKLNSQYNISVRKVVPLSYFEKINFSVIRKNWK